MDFVNIYLKLMVLLDNAVRKLLIFFAGMMAITIILQVLCRYIMKNPLLWTEELARYLMIWMVFIGTSCIIKEWDNIYVDFFLNKLKDKFRTILILIQKFVILGLLVNFFYLSFTVFLKVSLYQMTPALNISILWPQSSIIVGFFLMALQMVGVILDDIFKKNLCGGVK
jgi:TRAP-type C4-dicarboxylate transport system permease small subunit